MKDHHKVLNNYEFRNIFVILLPTSFFQPKEKNMSLRNIKKLQTPDLLQQMTDDSEESEKLTTPRKGNNFELVIFRNFSLFQKSSSW